MELITTHIGADFDALASVIAARKLYPAAKVVLPGSPEKAVRNFLSLWKDELRIDDEKAIDLNSVKRLIIVETRLASRIGKAEALIGKKDVRIEIYDHHPRTHFDIKADKDIFKPTGATVTIILNQLRKRMVVITPLEATLMALGIYEDTGSLTFQTTTQLDIDMVGYLFSQGASLNTVSSYLKRELSRKEIEYLSTLINNTQDYLVNGINIGIAIIESDEYVEDFAMLVHKLIDIENFNAVFAFAKSGNAIQMVARSNLANVRVNKIAESFGGGGHPYAASARIKGLGIDRIVAKLHKLLKINIRPKIFAKEMTSGFAKTVSDSATVAEAEKIMRRFKIGALAVFHKSRMLGIIRSSDIESATKKGYRHSRVKGYMKTNFTKINSLTPLYKIKQLIAKDKVGYIAVFRNKKFFGMISRSDIAKAIHHDLVSKKGLIRCRKRANSQEMNISVKMKKKLPLVIFNILKLSGSIADRMGYRVFAVGGFVRDILLGVKNFDVDIALEGEGLKFAKTLADRIKGALVIHKRFGTATVVTDLRVEEKRGPANKTERFKIDIATARTEYYEYPAALPTVRFSSLKQDLYRRDFTINAMAVSLNKKTFGALIDFFDGQRDLRSKKIRVLHDLSFVEDPTRIFRAVRFEQRYNFTISPHTEDLIKTAVSMDMFGRTQKQRLRDEIILILSEDEPAKALMRMHQLHELRFIHPRLKVGKKMLGLFYNIDKARQWYSFSFTNKRALDAWIIYFMAMVDGLSLKELRRLCEKFVFTKGDERRLISAKRKAGPATAILQRKKALSPSAVYKLLEPLSYEAIIFIFVKTKSQIARERISMFFKRYNNARLSISGKDLKAIGIAPGPIYKKILNKILFEKLDGNISSRKDELRLAQRLKGRSI